MAQLIGKNFGRVGTGLALMAIAGVLTGCGGSPTSDETAASGRPAVPASLAEIDQTLKAREAVYACIDLSFSVSRYSEMMNQGIKQASDQFYQQSAMVDSDIGHDAMMQNLKINQDAAKDRYMPMIASFQRSAIPACRDVSVSYRQLVPRLAKYPKLRSSVEKCAILADRLLAVMTWKAGKEFHAWSEVEPGMIPCRKGLETAAKALGIAMHDTFAPSSDDPIPDQPAPGAATASSSQTVAASPPVPAPTQAAIAKAEQAIGQPWITDADVLTRAQPDQRWSSTLTYQVWEDGKAHNCTAENTQGTMGDFLCSLIEARATYKPAIRTDGTIARTQVTVKFGWS